MLAKAGEAGVEDSWLQFIIIMLGFAGGAVFGLAARSAHFCTLGAIEETYYGVERTRLRTWLLAIGTAIALTQALDMAGIIELERSYRLNSHIAWGGAIIGGLMFGLGMALVGTCAFGMLVRLGSGDMRALLSVLVMGIAGFMTFSGILAHARLNTVGQLSTDLSSFSSQAIHELLFGASPNGRLVVVVVAVAATAGWALSRPRFRRNWRQVLAGTVMGAIIAYGWLVTSTLGQETIYPQQPDSYSFVHPIGQSILWLMISTSSSATFLIGGVFGVVAGAFAAAWWQGEVIWEAFDDAHEMRRHLAGAALMGIGGTMAAGCTIGQGMTGMAALSLTALLAILAIVGGALIGIRLLIEGEWPAFLRPLMALFGARREDG